MKYRHIQQARDRIDDLQRHLRNAYCATDMRVVVEEINAAQALADEVRGRLEEGDEGRQRGEAAGEQAMSRAAAGALSTAMTQAQKVGLAENIDQARDRMFDFKTQVDAADTYLRVALAGAV